MSWKTALAWTLGVDVDIDVDVGIDTKHVHTQTWVLRPFFVGRPSLQARSSIYVLENKANSGNWAVRPGGSRRRRPLDSADEYKPEKPELVHG